MKIVIGADVSQATRALAQVSQSLGNVRKPAADATTALSNLSRIAQDAPYGFIGIQNNLNPMLESFQRLQKEAGGTGAALKAMVSSMTGPAGVGLALGIVSSLVVAFGDKLNGSKKEIEATVSAFDTLSSSQVIGKVGSEFDKAFSSVSQLRTELQLAKDGILSKTDVVRHYNETLGDTIGKVQTLDQVENALAKNAEAYIRFTLLKAAAQTALSDAAKKAVQAAEITATQITGPAININDDNFTRQQKERQTKLIGVLKSGAAAKVEEGKNSLLRIAEDFNRQAALIAQKFNFDFFAGDLKDKITKKVKDKVKKDGSLTLPPLRFDVQPFLRQSLVGGDVVGKKRNAVLDELLKNLDAAQKAQQEKAKLLADTIESAVTPAIQGMFDAFTDGKNVMQSFLSGIASGLKSLLSRLAAALAEALALKAVFSLLGVGQIGNIKNGSVGSIFKSLLGFADGGVVFGPTAALIGEGRGTSRSNPEIVAPLDKLKQYIQGSAGGQFPEYLPVTRITDKEIVMFYKKATRGQGRAF